MSDITRIDEPADGDERSVLLGWLSFHRDGLRMKCAGITPDQLVASSALPSKLTLLGLMRHLTEMERVYATWALGPKAPLHFVWGDYTDDGPEWDFDVDATMVDGSFAKFGIAARALSARPFGSSHSSCRPSTVRSRK